MMNVVAIFLLVTSLATAGFWSPSPEKHDQDVNVIVKDGRRVVVVEYDEDGHPKTKVSISPEHETLDSATKQVGDEAVTTAEMDKTGRAFAPRELICDAFGKCKHRVSATFGKAKDKVSEEVHEMKEAAKDAKDALGGTLGKGGESVSRKAHEAETRAGDAFERTKEAVKEEVKEAAGKAKESVSRKAHEAGERAGEAVKRTRDATKAGTDMGKTIAGDVARNVSEAAEVASDKVREKSEKAEAAARHATDKFIEFGNKYLWPHVSWSSIMSLMSLLGFSTAYGVCMWVTFISSYVLAGALPRHQFGMVQSKIYPVYFRALVASIGAALFGHSLSDAGRLLSTSAKPHVFQPQAYNLLGSLLMVLANMLYLEPRATKVMFERMRLEKEEGRGREHASGEGIRQLDGEVVAGAAGTGTIERSGEEVRSRIARLNRRLRNLNTYSSLLNILTLMSLTWHLVYLSQRLASTC